MFPSGRYQNKNPGGSSAKTDKNASYQKCGPGLNWSIVGRTGAELLHTFHLDQDSVTDDIYEVRVISSANKRAMTQMLANEWHQIVFCPKHEENMYGSRTAGTLTAES